MNSLQESTWLAGLLEGEGCFRVQMNNTTPGSRDRLKVQLKMTDKDVIERAYSLAPGGTISLEKSKSPKHKDAWRLEWQGQRAENLMRRIHSYMGERRHAKIAECLTRTNLSHHCREVPT